MGAPRGFQNHQVTFPSPILRVARRFCSGLDNPSPLPFFLPIPPPTSNPGGRKWRKAHQPRSLSTSLCFPARPEQTSINSACSHPPSSLLSCPFCVFFFFSPLSDYVFRLRKEQLSSVAWGYKKLQLPVASTTWLWRLKGQEAMEPIWILGETPQLNPFCPNSGSAAMSHAETLIPHFLWPSTFWRPPPSPDKGFSSQVWGNQASWTWNQWRRRNTPFPFQSSLVGLFFSQQGDSKLAGLSKLQISMFPALAKGKFAG